MLVESERQYGYLQQNGWQLFLPSSERGGLGKLYTGKAAIKHPAAKYYAAVAVVPAVSVSTYARVCISPALQDGL